MSTDDLPERNETDFIFICPTNLECVLAAGGAEDIAALREWCADLPRKSYGRVFIELEHAGQAEEFEPIATPPGVGITWLVREPAGARGTMAPGAAVTRAVDAWLDEWLRGDPLSGRSVRLWPGALNLPGMVGFWQRVEGELAEMSAAAAEYQGRVI